MQGYEKEIVHIIRNLNEKIEIYAIIPRMIAEEDANNLLESKITGIRISIESDEMGIYKSFNYEIFERRESIVIAFDGNSAVSNLVQEAKNGKGKAKIYVNEENSILYDKAKSLGGYVIPFNINQDITSKIIEDTHEIC